MFFRIGWAVVVGVATEGLRERTVVARGDADQLWPRDGQMALADIDQDGNVEVWFVACSGNLWRYQPNHSPSVTHVSEIHGLAGPIVASRPGTRNPPCLYLSCDRSVLRLQSTSEHSERSKSRGAFAY
jgi:hypothetical protein